MTTIYDSPAVVRTDLDTEIHGDRLLAVLEGAVDSVADADPGDLDSVSPRGRELLDLAALGREAIAVLGADPGAVVTAAPGVVVVRELVAVTRLLRSAVSGTDGR